MKLLVTGGTVFVSRYTAAYFCRRGHEVFVLNRGHAPQPAGAVPILADRHALGGQLKQHHFDAVLDITAYTAKDVDDLLDGLGSFDRYFFISSSAVYPETLPQPFGENSPLGPNRFWGAYGTGKIAAEQALTARFPQAVILRPPYLYGPGNNVYREAFVFDCAEADRAFCLPQDGGLPLQFFAVEDLCRLLEVLLAGPAAGRILNVGDPQPVTARAWVEACYAVLGRTPRFYSVPKEIPQRSYFPFLDYAYRLDVTRQQALLPGLMPLQEGLAQAWAWYRQNREAVRRKPLLAFIDEELRGRDLVRLE